MRPTWCLAALAAGCATTHGDQVVDFGYACLGGCEEFEVQVYADGFVDFHSEADVKFPRTTAHLSKPELAAVEAELARASFSQLATVNMDCGIDDYGALVSITSRGERIEFFELCPTVPLRALLLVGGLVETLHLRDWLRTDYPL